jgi:thioredoxin 1
MKTIRIALVLCCCFGCDQASSTTKPLANVKVELLKFEAVWCGPCREQKPIIEQLKKEFPTVEFTAIDTDQNANMAALYQVSQLPTLVVLVDGREAVRYTGLQSHGTLKNVLNRATTGKLVAK